MGKKLRSIKESTTLFMMNVFFLLVILIPVLILILLWWKSKAVVQQLPLKDLIFSSQWNPANKEFGFLPFILSSFWVTLISVFLSVPICLLSAIHLIFYAHRWILKLMQPVIDILAGIPSVVYGAWGVLMVVPFIRENLAPLFGIQSSGYGLISAAIVLAVMITPFILNMFIEIIRMIPDELMEIGLSLGIHQWIVIKRVILKKALPGLVSVVGLGVSRAFGETMAVLMVAGNVIKFPENLFDPVYPLPALIANNYGEMLTVPMYDSAIMFAALLLFLVVMLFNFISRFIIIKLDIYK